MADSAGGERLRINLRGDETRRRIPRPVLYLAAFVAVGLLWWVSPASVSALDVGFKWLQGILFLAFAVMLRRASLRMLGMPMWLASLALAAAFISLAILETRQALG